VKVRRKEGKKVRNLEEQKLEKRKEKRGEHERGGKKVRR